MQVDIIWDRVVNGYATRDITNIEVDEYSEIILCLKIRLEQLEEKLIEYKQSEDKRLKVFIPKREKELLRLKNLIKLME
ncbi:hypothetical protein CBE01nite_29930 [Clostridium beijerinckii]|uniref:Uncharacterized protein n=1 Tax=Clostridium beijerinckii TaxID=1520 RepID=A0AB74VDA6_CLOBE|nr:hypothetical protein [Clostridium beijerinckii]NRZ28772.1 hypothetical protein [Clostridium beijerinckii]NYB95452.1 hypothetical protein [Clostridium beijerinckii]OOM24567.1 hypothetical protein CLBEI_20280 [Clostridium beijerinckii]QUN34448.1 hypothetical protein KEC93_21375 [Clostridium beijerinckii]SQB00596.1 Uncharacterised protein [Clostridium beijerinckii]